jgi:hypothetical protein
MDKVGRDWQLKSIIGLSVCIFNCQTIPPAIIKES